MNIREKLAGDINKLAAIKLRPWASMRTQAARDASRQASDLLLNNNPNAMIQMANGRFGNPLVAAMSQPAIPRLTPAMMRRASDTLSPGMVGAKPAATPLQKSELGVIDLSIPDAAPRSGIINYLKRIVGM
jgi:hypothetical protein